ncbi:hypothetical protein HZS_7919 [Henneguya salminicola]|nr:hypothetical protein HZS_7919 [Henneguya salminicola]
MEKIAVRSLTITRNVFSGFLSFNYTFFYLVVLCSNFWIVITKYSEKGKIEIINYGLFFLCSNSSAHKFCVPLNQDNPYVTGYQFIIISHPLSVIFGFASCFFCIISILHRDDHNLPSIFLSLSCKKYC